MVAGVNTGGKDTVIASFSGYALADGGTVALTYLENLTLTGTAASGTGNRLANVLKASDTTAGSLTGLAGNDTLYGGAGGVDTLIGGDGSDTYFVSTGDIVTEASALATDIDTVNCRCYSYTWY